MLRSFRVMALFFAVQPGIHPSGARDFSPILANANDVALRSEENSLPSCKEGPTLEYPTGRRLPLIAALGTHGRATDTCALLKSAPRE